MRGTRASAASLQHVVCGGMNKRMVKFLLLEAITGFLRVGLDILARVETKYESRNSMHSMVWPSYHNLRSLKPA